MDKDLLVSVDAASWGTKAIPGNFVSGTGVFNIGEVLLTIGIITAPPRASGFSLAEYWAWVRYISAISRDGSLKLVSDYFDLDAHQKTLLSDDFGMGFSVYWLWQRMNFSFICDGRYFVEHYLGHYGGHAPARPPGKRGPSKCPDFVCWSPAGNFHVVECKGTQSGPHTKRKQLQAAKIQKNTINFPAGRSGEKLACAVEIAYEGGAQESSLIVADPERKPVLNLSYNDIPFIEDTMYRGLTSRVLAVAGLPATALFLSEPNAGKIRANRMKAAKVLRESLEKRDQLQLQLSEDELKRQRGKTLFTEAGKNFIGKEAIIELPGPVDVGRQHIRRVRIRQGVSRELIDSFEPSKFSDLLQKESAPLIVGADHKFVTKSAGTQSLIQLGDLYHAELELLEG